MCLLPRFARGSNGITLKNRTIKVTRPHLSQDYNISIFSFESTLRLADLAGSDSGHRERPNSDINSSLLTLGRVMSDIVGKAEHVPYRDSYLTLLLKVHQVSSTPIGVSSPSCSRFEKLLKWSFHKTFKDLCCYSSICFLCRR